MTETRDQIERGWPEAASKPDLDEMFENAKAACALLKALAHENRLLILCILAEGEKSVTELEDLLGLRQPSVSQQLARLRIDRMVDTRRDGKTIYYRLSNKSAERVIETLYDIYCSTAPDKKGPRNDQEL